MDTYAYYLGNMKIPREKQKEFNERMLKILEQGGMMTIESLKLCGYRIFLIHPPRPDQDGKLNFNYNYFGDSFTEKASYDCGISTLTTGQLGCYEFSWVICAAYLFYEFYAEDYGLAAVNGEILDASCYIGWLNHLFHEKWTNARLSDLWVSYEFLHDQEAEYRADIMDRLICHAQGIHFNINSLLAFLYVEKDRDVFRTLMTGSSENENAHNSRILCTINKLSDTLQKIKKGSVRSDSDEISHLLSLLTFDDPEKLMRRLSESSPYFEFLLHGITLPPQVAVKEIAHTYGVDFWALWNRIDKNAYSSWKKIHAEDEREKCIPVSPVDTASFLKVHDNEICFLYARDTSRNPYTSDDDRAYYRKSDASNDVHFSESMNVWMASLKKRLDKIAERDMKLRSATDFLSYILGLLDSANRIYHRIFAFTDMFYDYAAHPELPHYQASMILFEQLIQENRTEGSSINKAGLDWELTDRNLTFNKGRLAIKRYLAILANRMLRQEVLGF